MSSKTIVFRDNHGQIFETNYRFVQVKPKKTFKTCFSGGGMCTLALISSITWISVKVSFLKFPRGLSVGSFSGLWGGSCFRVWMVVVCGRSRGSGGGKWFSCGVGPGGGVS